MKTNCSIRRKSAVLLFGVLGLALSTVARDRFEYDPTPKKPTAPEEGGEKPEARQMQGVTIEIGEIGEAFDSSGSSPEMAFYVPKIRPPIVQVTIEKKIFHRPHYLVKAIRRGTICGVVIPRSMLDKSGLRPNNYVDEAKIQEALRTQPIRLIVK